MKLYHFQSTAIFEAFLRLFFRLRFALPTHCAASLVLGRGLWHYHMISLRHLSGIWGMDLCSEGKLCLQEVPKSRKPSNWDSSKFGSIRQESTMSAYQFPKKSNRSKEQHHKKDSALRTDSYRRTLRKNQVSMVHEWPTTFFLQETDCVNSETPT